MAKQQVIPPPVQTTHDPLPAPPRRVKLWLVARIIDYRFQALAPSDPDDPESTPDWTDLGVDTLLSADRERMYQAARASGGLLMSADGLPGAARVSAFHAMLRALRDTASETPREDVQRTPYKPHSAMNRSQQSGASPGAAAPDAADDEVPY